MRYGLEDFNHAAMTSFRKAVSGRNGKDKIIKIGSDDIFIILWFADYLAGNKKILPIEVDGVNYYYLPYDKILHDLTNLDFNKKTIGEHLKKLVQLDVLKVYFPKEFAKNPFIQWATGSLN